MSYEQKTFYQASIGVSVRRVSNGYSIKINHSNFPEEIGKIIVASDQKEAFKVLKELFDKCDAKEKETSSFRNSDCGEPDSDI